MNPQRKNLAIFEFSCSELLASYFSARRPLLETLEKDTKLFLREKFQIADSLPHRNHGLIFQGAIAPNQTRTFTYYKVFVSDWKNEEDLLTRAQFIIQNISAKDCHGT
jgi:hypothetical protein